MAADQLDCADRVPNTMRHQIGLNIITLKQLNLLALMISLAGSSQAAMVNDVKACAVLPLRGIIIDRVWG